MTDICSESTPAPTLRVRTPGDLVEAVPYLLGFHPRDSVVFVGLDITRVIVTARLDLPDARAAGVLDNALSMIARGGASSLVALVYDDDAAGGSARLPHAALIALTGEISEAHRLELRDALLVAQRRWWSFACLDERCCPPEGNPVPGDASPAAATATFAGLVALPGRSDVEAILAPDDDAAREALIPLLGDHENSAVQAVLDGRSGRHQRGVKRAIFAAARDADAALFPGVAGEVSDDQICRYGIGLLETAIRDAVWLAIDGRRLDGRALWREMARRLPSPYDASPLFLFGWAEWREGNGALAGIAAEAALASDPGYSAADLLLSAVVNGVNPHRVPRLRLPRTA